MLLARAFHDGIGVEADAAEAVHWVRAAAYQRYGEGMYRLGVCYEYGDG
ncbi:sel1 repeat family protein, partial [Clostridium sp. MCC328]|nr:sel1 repeat family protein [Clostridium sp. MCC328]